MAAPKGNQNAIGNRGGGRPSAYQEKANVEWLAEAFFKEHTEEELLELAGKKSISSKMVADAIKGNKDYVLAIFKKLFPDLSKSEQDHKFDFSDLIKGKQNV